MAPKVSKTAAEPTLYEILSLTPKHLEGQAGTAQQKVVKKAYHRALLKHHPDKNNASASASTTGSEPSSPSQPKSSSSKPETKSQSQSQSQSKPSSKSDTKATSSTTPSTSPPQIHYTIDQIQEAYTILSDGRQRSQYDRALRTTSKKQASFSYQIGIETVDLDDVGYDERRGVYHRGCRCGNERGYAFTEDNLEEFEDDGVLMVECLDCSLWLRVLFAAAVVDDEDDGGRPQNGQAAWGNAGVGGTEGETLSMQREGGDGQGQKNAVGRERERTGVAKGNRKGKGWNFNFSFSWGLSLMGSATGNAGASSR